METTQWTKYPKVCALPSTIDQETLLLGPVIAYPTLFPNFGNRLQGFFTNSANEGVFNVGQTNLLD